MLQQPLIWQVPLHVRPELRFMGLNTHGLTEPVSRYQLLGFWSVHFYTYTADFSVNGQKWLIKPGTVTIVPPDADLIYQWRGRSRHLCAHFTFPNSFSAADCVPMKTIDHMSHAFRELYRRLEEALGWFGNQPRRAEVRLWDVLWELSELQSNPARSVRTGRELAGSVRQMIERRLAEPLSVAALAEEAGLSHNHLTRLFRSEFSNTVAGYIRQRRVERARHLLAHSTIPIKSVASEVGIPDLHLFNKTIRAELGHSPRAIRETARKSR
jgi:AraC family transcriptional regulator